MKRVFDSIELVPTMEAEASRYSTLLIPWIQNYALIQDFAGPRSAVGNVSCCRCVSDCRSRGHEFDLAGPVPYFRGD